MQEEIRYFIQRLVTDDIWDDAALDLNKYGSKTKEHAIRNLDRLDFSNLKPFGMGRVVERKTIKEDKVIYQKQLV